MLGRREAGQHFRFCCAERGRLREHLSNDGLININTASKEDLLNVTGIGESKANAIIEYRSQNRFDTIEDIMNIQGIKESLFNKIKDEITV